MVKTKKRSSDDIFQVYRSLNAQFPVARLAVSPKSVNDLQRLEFIQYAYNRRKMQRYEKKTKKLTECTKLLADCRLLLQKDIQMIDDIERKVAKNNSQYESQMTEYTYLFNSRNWLRRIANFFGLFYSKELVKLSEKINNIRGLYAVLIQESNEIQSRNQKNLQGIDELSTDIEYLSAIPKPPVIDFQELYVTQAIIHNRFERGLVSDLKENMDIVGRAGLLAADINKRGSKASDRNDKMG
ncbi:MAG: hypothetical protein ACTSP4_00150 [Candidatus Hodarchaeales archaeon]